jgi:methyltransferase (TIGR00027 family)
MAALARGLHRRDHGRPWVIDDAFAFPLVGPGAQELERALRTILREPVAEQTVGFGIGRARYAEDRLEAGDFAQYVVLGAGLDSFALRRPDMLRRLRVFEIDHPATQAWKRERLEVLALSPGDEHVLAPLDFESETLRDGLDAAGFDWSAPALYSWMGVAPYLTVDAIETTLRAVAGSAPGSEIAFSYGVTAEYMDDLGREFMTTMRALAAQSGEPIDTFFAPSDAEALVARCGLEVAEHIDREELHARYFAAREDGLTPYNSERLLTAAVPR